MIQDIGAGRYHNEYKNTVPEDESRMICCRSREVLVDYEEGMLSFLTYSELREKVPEFSGEMIYLFSIDEITYFLIQEEDIRTALEAGLFPQLSWQKTVIFRDARPKEASFAAITGHQLAEWYASRRYCPRCGKKMVHSEAERMMHCEACGQMEYPKLSPAVIVAVMEGDRLLMTKYAGREFKNYALIAGFTEIGETVEETVRREVMEEVGLKVKNIRYYKSQPWSFTSTLLMGYFCEVDGGDEIHLDRTELSVGKWCTRDEIPDNDDLSLTREMMQVFKDDRVPPYIG